MRNGASRTGLASLRVCESGGNSVLLEGLFEELVAGGRAVEPGRGVAPDLAHVGGCDLRLDVVLFLAKRKQSACQKGIFLNEVLCGQSGDGGAPKMTVVGV